MRKKYIIAILFLVVAVVIVVLLFATGIISSLSGNNNTQPANNISNSPSFSPPTPPPPSPPPPPPPSPPPSPTPPSPTSPPPSPTPPSPTPPPPPPPPPTPIDCVLGSWSDWSPCSATICDTQGTQTKTRAIITQPQYGGQPCTSTTESQPCNAPPCPIDCQVSAWSDWSTCKNGSQTRTRTVTVPEANGGQPCPTLTDSTICGYISYPGFRPVSVTGSTSQETVDVNTAEDHCKNNSQCQGFVYYEGTATYFDGQITQITPADPGFTLYYDSVNPPPMIVQTPT